MKKYFVFILVLVFCSCDYSAKQQAKREAAQNAALLRAQQDSIAKARQDSILQAKIAHDDSLAIIVWGDIEFGMTKKEVLRSKAAQKVTHRYSDEIVIASYYTPDVCINFGGKNDNEVVSANILSIEYKWSDFSDLVGCVKSHIKMFADKYGKPDEKYIYLESLSYRDLDDKKELLIARWIIGNDKGKNGIKQINITARASSDKLRYSYRISIKNSAFPKHPKEPTPAEIQAKNERERKAKEAKAYSF